MYGSILVELSYNPNHTFSIIYILIIEIAAIFGKCGVFLLHCKADDGSVCWGRQEMELVMAAFAVAGRIGFAAFVAIVAAIECGNEGVQGCLHHAL